MDLIYGAAIEPALWVDVMQQLIVMTGGEGGVLMRTDIANGKGAATSANGDDATIDSYFSHYYSVNPLALVRDPPSYVAGWKPKVLRDEDWMPREDLESSEYYNDFLRPLSAEWGMMVRLGLSGFNHATMNIGRGFRRGRFENSEITAMERMHPHLMRAYALSDRFASLQGLNAGLATALDRCPSAMFLLQEDARILHVNAAAERLLTTGDPLVTTGGRLCATEADATGPLAVLIARAAAASWEERSAGSLSLRVRGRRLPLMLSATPLRLEEVSVFAQGSAVLLCVTGPVAGSTPVDIKLAEQFGLTPAESRLAVALHEGLTLREASIRHSVSVNTARAQLSSIFAKTQTHRQADLIRLVVSYDATDAGRPSLALFSTSLACA